MSENSSSNVTIVINNNGMGHADTELTHKLAATYLSLLELDGRLPDSICLYAEGVKLATTDSPVLDDLRALVGKGVSLLVCTTCLNFFDLYDELQVGTAIGMREIMDAQWRADKVITL